MSSTILAFSSDRDRSKTRPSDDARVSGLPLSVLHEGSGGVVMEVRASDDGRADRLLGLGVSPGARIKVLQTFPGIVFLCDQTELAVERGVAHSIIVHCEDGQP